MPVKQKQGHAVSIRVRLSVILQEWQTFGILDDKMAEFIYYEMNKAMKHQHQLFIEEKRQVKVEMEMKLQLELQQQKQESYQHENVN